MPTGLKLRVFWAPNPAPVGGYITHVGPTPSAATIVLGFISVNEQGFDPLAPMAEYHAACIGVNVGDTVCFRLKAYTSAGSSDFSGATCVTV